MDHNDTLALMATVGLVGCILIGMFASINEWCTSKTRIVVIWVVLAIWAALWLGPPLAVLWIKGVMG